jgi:hypothetical protein
VCVACVVCLACVFGVRVVHVGWLCALLQTGRPSARRQPTTDLPIQTDHHPLENKTHQADELFTTGTAVVVSPVGSLTFKGTRKQYGVKGEPAPVGLEMYTALTRLQTEKDPDPFGWVHPVV